MEAKPITFLNKSMLFFLRISTAYSDGLLWLGALHVSIHVKSAVQVFLHVFVFVVASQASRRIHVFASLV